MGIFRLKRKCFNRAFEELLKTPYKDDPVINFYQSRIEDALKNGETVAPSTVFGRSESHETRLAGGSIDEQLENILNRFEERNKAIIAEGGTPRKLTEERLNKLLTAYNNKYGRVNKVSIRNLKKYVADSGIDYEKLTGTPLSLASKNITEVTPEFNKYYLNDKINKHGIMREGAVDGATKSPNTPAQETRNTTLKVETPVIETPNTTPKTETAPNNTPKTNPHGTGTGGKGAGTSGKGVAETVAETAGNGKGGAKKMGKAGKIALISTAIAGAGALGYGLYKHNKNKNKEQHGNI